MKNFLEKWKRMNTFERAMTAVNLASTALAVVFALLYLVDISPMGMVIVLPLMGVALLSQSGLFWKKDRAMGLFAVMGAIFLFGMTFYMAN